MLIYLNGDEDACKYCDKNYDKYQKYSHNIIHMTCCYLKYTSDFFEKDDKYVFKARNSCFE